jgi:hypothetical protein
MNGVKVKIMKGLKAKFDIARGAHPKIPLQKPAARASRGVLAIANAIDPETLVRLVLDPEIVAHREQFGVLLPPRRRPARDHRRTSRAARCRAR